MAVKGVSEPRAWAIPRREESKDLILNHSLHHHITHAPMAIAVFPVPG